MPEVFRIMLCIMVAVSLGGALLVFIDKYNAIHKLYRISEATLMCFGIFGGALMMFGAMKLFHHKTKKPKFMITFPLLAVVHIVILLLSLQQ